MEEENALREKAALEAMNDFTDSDISDDENAADISTESEVTHKGAHSHDDHDDCCGAMPNLVQVKEGSKQISDDKIVTKKKKWTDFDDDELSKDTEDEDNPVEFEIAPDGQIVRKKRNIFDPKSNKPFWGGEFFPLPVPEYWPPMETNNNAKKYVRDAGSGDKASKMGMPVGLLEDDTPNVNLRVELHDFGENFDDPESDIPAGERASKHRRASAASIKFNVTDTYCHRLYHSLSLASLAVFYRGTSRSVQRKKFQHNTTPSSVAPPFPPVSSTAPFNRTLISRFPTSPARESSSSMEVTNPSLCCRFARVELKPPSGRLGLASSVNV